MSLRNGLYRTIMRPTCRIGVGLLFLCSLFWPSLAHAQFRGSLRGTVTDPSNAAVTGATVTLTNTDTNNTLTSTSDANGIYEFNALPPAPYKLTVEKAGFEKKVLEHVQIIPEQPNALNVQLELGQVEQSVVVSGTTEALDTETATVSGTVSSNQIEHMPSFGRDVMKLAELAPGVFGDEAQASGGGSFNLPGTQTGGGASGGNQGIFQTENGAQVIANGNQTEDNGISIDGISTTSAVWGGTTVITPSEDSIESVKVVTNSYDAEYGRFTGAQLQLTSMSGTNQYHGDLFFTMHRPGFNAYQRFDGEGNSVLKDPYFFDQLGGNVGGPIWKNKIFAFFNYETIRAPQGQAVIGNGWYDTAAFDGLAPSSSIASKYLTLPGSAVVSRGINNATCTDAGLVEGVNCVTIPGQGLNIGTPLTTPLGTQDPTWTSPSSPGDGSGLGTTADIANYITASATTFSKAQYNGRIDANATENDRVSFAIYWVPQSTNFLNGPAREYNYFHHTQINEAESAIWDHTFSPTLLNEFRVNAAGWHWNEITSNPQSPVGLPTDQIGQIGSISVSSFGPNVGSILDQWTYSWKDVATKVEGRHTIKLGGEVTRLFYLNDCAGCGVPNYTFFNLWDFLNDAPHEENSGFNPSTGFPSTERQDDREGIWAMFVQDDFKLRRNLTLNLGLRYSFFGPLSSKEGNMFVAVPGAGAAFLTGLDVRLGHSWNAQKDNLGPEIGFAWSPGRFHDRLVVRGGYGLNYNEEEIAISANVGANPGLVVFPTFSMSTPGSPNPGIMYAVSSGIHNLYGYPANPNAIVSFGSNGLPTTGSVNVGIFPNDLPTMRVQHYSLETQYDLGHAWIASLGYEGSKSGNIFFHENPNAVPAALGYTLNPEIGGGDYWGVGGWGNYNAMLAELKHQFSQQFTADAQFAWSKSMDTSSGPYFEQPYPYNLNLDYGPSDYNAGKAFKLYGVWQPVIFRGDRGWIEKIAGGWSLSGILNVHSGFPWSPLVNVVGGNLYCGTCGYSELFPAAYLGGAGHSTSNDAFKTPASSNYPNGGTAYFSTPTYTPYSGTNYGSALPEAPGVHRNSLTGPGYKDLDMTLAKDFGLPRMPVLGEDAKLEIRLDAYNVFNNLNFNPGSISNVITNANFGTETQALAGRVATVGARFSF
jgi:Carboxypeptidase regulatory-like domain